MNASLVLENIGVFSLQAAALILVGLLAPRLLKLARPLVFLQMLLVAVLLLPVCQNWSRPIVVVPRVSSERVVLPSTALQRVDAAAPVAMDWALVGLAVLSVGVAGRAVWLALGLARLRSLRKYAEPVDDAVAVSTEIAGPVTFGFWRPVILLPPAVMALSEEARAAILAHEQAHIRRRDWLFALSEEIVLCVLWFHPAVWLLVSRIRLVREQVVDLEASRVAASREIYVDALLAVAEARMQPYFAPAPPFLRRRQLAARIHSLVLEVPMSRLRTIVSYGAAALCTIAMALWVTTSFPLQGAPQLGEAPRDYVSVQGAQLIFSTKPVYPAVARRAKIEGAVTLDVTLAASGEVVDAKVVAGPQELRKSALAAVLNWQFQAGESAARVVIDFRTTAAPEGPNITKVFIDKSMPSPLEKTLRARLQDFEGQPYSDEIHAIVRSVSPTLKVRVESHHTGGANEMIVYVGPNLIEATVPGRIRVGGAEQAANLLSKPEPLYPPLARQARIQGTVRFNAVVDRNGDIAATEVLSGHPLLIPNAQEAVRHYRYRVAQQNGRPVEVATQIDVNFIL